MRKFLLLLLCLLATGISASAETVIEITPADMQKANNSTKYVTTAFEFSVGADKFKTNQVNPSTGQIKVNAIGGSAFQLYNTTALNNISKVELTADANILGTWHMTTGESQITAAATATAANAVAGTKVDKTITWIPAKEAPYFHINLTTKGSGAVKFTSIKVYCNDGTPKEPVEYTCADFTDREMEIGTSYTLNLGASHPASLAFTSSDNSVASVDANGVITANTPGTATITAKWNEEAEAFLAGEKSFTVTVLKPAPIVTDELVWTNFVTTSSSTYMTEPVEYTSPTTQITYRALFAPNKYFQIRTDKSNTGIVSSANPNGYILKKVTIKFNSSPKAVDIYGDNTAYSAPSDLFATADNGNKSKGTNIGSISADGDLDATGEYTFFGLRSSSGARYIDKITLVWEIVEKEPVDYTALDNVTVPGLFPDDTFQLPLGATYPSDMIFMSDDESIATVSDNGLITAVNPGTTTINAEWDADAEGNFKAGSATISVTVKQPLQQAGMSFLHSTVYGKLGVGVAGQAAYYDGDARITYTSSDETILKVNPSTGMITKDDVIRTGEVTITATAPETDSYHAATASYTIIIQDPNATDTFESGDAMFKFDAEEAYGMKLFTSFNSTTDNNVQIYETGVTSIESAPVTLAFAGDYRHWSGTGDDYHLRTYQASDMTFSVPEGYFITKITFNQNRGSYTPYTSPGSEITVGKMSTGSVDGQSQSIWEAIDAEGNEIDLSSVTLHSEAAHSRIYTMTIVWKKMTSEQDPAKLSFTTTCYNDLVGTEITVNAVNNPNNVPVSYSIDNLVEGTDYTIAEEGDNLKIRVEKTGVYTLRAKSNATDAFLPGIAILRLNVFPPVELKLNDGETYDLTEEGEIVLPENGGSFTIDGNYPNTVRILYSLNDGEEQPYTGQPVEFTDDATLTYHLEYAETNRYRYTMNHTVCVTPPAPECNVADGDLIPDDGIFTFTSKEGTALLYRVNTTSPAAYSPMRAPAATEGWSNSGTNSYSLDSTELPEGTEVTVSTKALHSNGRIESAITERSFTVGNGTVTGIGTIDANTANEVEYYNLQGVRIANPAAGSVVIRRDGGKATKIRF